jgi:hypothetical protein
MPELPELTAANYGRPRLVAVEFISRAGKATTEVERDK